MANQLKNLSLEKDIIPFLKENEPGIIANLSSILIELQRLSEDTLVKINNSTTNLLKVNEFDKASYNIHIANSINSYKESLATLLASINSNPASTNLYTSSENTSHISEDVSTNYASTHTSSTEELHAYDLTYDFKGTYPRGILFHNKSYEVNSWSILLATTLNLFGEINPTVTRKFIQSTRLRGTRDGNIRSPRYIPSLDLLICSHFSVKEITILLTKLLVELAIPIENFKIQIL